MEQYSTNKIIRINHWYLFYQITFKKHQIKPYNLFLNSLALIAITTCSFFLFLIISFNHLAIPCNRCYHIILIIYRIHYLQTTFFLETTFNLTQYLLFQFQKNSISSLSKSENAQRRKFMKRKNVHISITLVTGEDAQSNSTIPSMNVLEEIASFKTTALWCITKQNNSTIH